MRPLPSLEYSGENGFWLMRISRMESLDGSVPLLNPSIMISPPPGPDDGPASACKSCCRSSGSSERDCKSLPLNTRAPALLDGSVDNNGVELLCTVTCCTTSETFNCRFSFCVPPVRLILIGCGCVRSGAEATTVYSPTGSPVKL